MGNQVCCPPAGNQGTVDHRSENNLALKRGKEAQFIQGFIQSDDPDAECQTPTGSYRGTITFVSHGKPIFDKHKSDGTHSSQGVEAQIARAMLDTTGPPSTGSSSNQGDSRKKVVINYAEHVNQQKMQQYGEQYDE